MEKVSKFEKVALKAIAVGRFALMATLTGMFGFIALAGLLCFFKYYGTNKRYAANTYRKCGI